jgi:hypothetical protein
MNFGILAAIIGALGGALAVLAAIGNMKVDQNSEGFKCRLGKPVRDRRRRWGRPPSNSLYVSTPRFTGWTRVYRGGWVPGIPGLHSARSLHVVQRQIWCEPFQVQFLNGLLYHTKALVNITIPRAGLYDAIFRWTDVDGQIRSMLQAELLEYGATRQKPHRRRKAMALDVKQRLEQAFVDDNIILGVHALLMQEFSLTPISAWAKQEDRRVWARCRALLGFKQRHPDHLDIIQAAGGDGGVSSPGLPFASATSMDQMLDANEQFKPAA